MKRVPGISGNWVVKSILPPRSGSSLEAVEPNPQKNEKNVRGEKKRLSRRKKLQGPKIIKLGLEDSWALVEPSFLCWVKYWEIHKTTGGHGWDAVSFHTMMSQYKHIFLRQLRRNIQQKRWTCTLHLKIWGNLLIKYLQMLHGGF